MANNTQLTRITAPSINEVDYASKMEQVFNNINENFKKIASLPFLQGVQGDSYQLVEVKIWDGDTNYGKNCTLTEEGKLLLNNIFNLNNIQSGETYEWYTTDKKSPLFSLNINDISPISSFINENGKITNNSLYFYAIYNDSGEIQGKQLGQYFYFIDGRIKVLGESYYDENKSIDNFVDYSGFYRYIPSEEKYEKTTILPNIYYDKQNNDICWEFNGKKTGISAIGVPGSNGTNAGFQFVHTESLYETGSSKIDGVFVSSDQGGKFETKEENPTAWSELKEGIAIIAVTKKNTISEGTIAYGEIRLSGGDWYAYWNDDTLLDPLLTYDVITGYFYNMGSTSSKNNAPHFLAIPSILDRSSSASGKTNAHVIRSGGTDSLVFEHGSAFNDNGSQKTEISEDNYYPTIEYKNYKINVEGKQKYSTLKIQNKNVEIGSSDKNTNERLLVDGKTKINGSLEVGTTASIGSNLTVSGKTTLGGSLDVAGTIKYTGTSSQKSFVEIINNTISVGCEVEPDNRLYVDGNARIYGTAKINTLNVVNDVSVGGSIGVTGNATIHGKLNSKDCGQITKSTDGYGSWYQASTKAPLYNSSYNTSYPSEYYPVVACKGATGNYSAGVRNDTFCLSYIKNGATSNKGFDLTTFEFDKNKWNDATDLINMNPKKDFTIGTSNDNKQLTVNGETHLNGTATVNGSFTINKGKDLSPCLRICENPGKIEVWGSTSASGNRLYVDGYAHFRYTGRKACIRINDSDYGENTVQIIGSTSDDPSRLYVNGKTNLNGKLLVTPNTGGKYNYIALRINDKEFAENNIYMGGVNNENPYRLKVVGNSYLDGSLTVTGAATIKGEATINGLLKSSNSWKSMQDISAVSVFTNQQCKKDDKNGGTYKSKIRVFKPDQGVYQYILYKEEDGDGKNSLAIPSTYPAGSTVWVAFDDNDGEDFTIIKRKEGGYFIGEKDDLGTVPGCMFLLLLTEGTYKIGEGESQIECRNVGRIFKCTGSMYWG